ncbi:MAG: hypothetical protein WAL80_08090 [Xanthobacteraceae bacterium]
MVEILRLTKRGFEGKWYVDLELSKGEMTALGRLTAQWAFLEYLIFKHSQMMARSLGSSVPEEAKSDSFRKRLRAWKSLATQAGSIDANYSADVLLIIERAGSIAGQRHKLTHGRIEWRGAKQNKIKVFSRANPKSSAWEIDKHGIDFITYKVAVLNYDLISIGSEPDTVHGASRRRRGTPSHSSSLPADATQNRLPSNHPKRRRQQRSSKG